MRKVVICENWAQPKPRQFPTHFPDSSDHSFTFMTVLILMIMMAALHGSDDTLHTLTKMTMKTKMTKMRMMWQRWEWWWQKWYVAISQLPPHLAISQSPNTRLINSSDKPIINLVWSPLYACDLLELVMIKLFVCKFDGVRNSHEPIQASPQICASSSARWENGKPILSFSLSSTC